MSVAIGVRKFFLAGISLKVPLLSNEGTRLYIRCTVSYRTLWSLAEITDADFFSHFTSATQANRQQRNSFEDLDPSNIWLLHGITEFRLV